MSEEVKVPAMGESITEAIVSQIFKDSGSFVEAEEELLELETDKVNQVLYAQISGTVQYLVEREETVAIGQVVAVIEPQKREKEEKEGRKQSKHLEENKQEEGSLPNVRMGVEEFVQEMQETRRQEKKTPQLVESADAQELEMPASFSERKEVRKKMSSIRKVIAKRLLEAKQSTAMLTSFNEVDMELVSSIRKQHQEEFQRKNGVKLGFMSFFVKACVSALKKFPEVNGYIDEDDIVYRHYFDIGIAVGTERGLVVPVVRDCDKLTFAEIEKTIASLAQKARTGKLSADELKGAGFTITNGGVYGSLFSTPIINFPQSAILGMHAIKDRPVAIEGKIEIRPMMYLALSYDHRLVDGKEAVSFLVHIKKALEEPGYLLLDG